MNDLPRQKLKEIIMQHGRTLCDDPKRCEAFLRDYCGEYRREIFILISALKQDVAKDLLNSSNIPIELLLGRLTKQMQNNLGLTEEAARYGVESWAVVLDKMTLQQIQQPTIKPPKTISRNQQPIVESTDPKATKISQTKQIDYINLERLLQEQKFRAADVETRKIILKVANREKEGCLRIEDAEKFPCKELSSIDQLWVKYSQGKFGISVQQKIYQSLGGTKYLDYDVWRSMGDRVGWREGDNWLNYKDLNFSQTALSGNLPIGDNWLGYNSYNFSQTAPSGHLPTLRGLGFRVLFGWMALAQQGGYSSLLSRHAECNTSVQTRNIKKWWWF
ncbi:MAG: GUN4 domain-containing protein [Cylindrospermopsis raciborskii PAMP2012]|uniref:GUN4 domain-containing protein n=1 Tax=Cylindrospermopsis raciborskii TaxID=77022 RepID=UPI0022CA0D79|nr:GUN4 domain-containing protein [Cylindrospermopsis raciborskii]MCZ2203055.1 GUN4 domain-containing protein [Cylindrospermopsis raciborskii PAMP2012]